LRGWVMAASCRGFTLWSQNFGPTQGGYSAGVARAVASFSMFHSR